MKKALLTLASTLALIAVTETLTAVPAMAQRPALVQDRDSKARNFYEKTDSCHITADACTVSFPAVPAGKRLVIEHVSAVTTMLPATAGFLNLLTLANTATGVFQFLPFTRTPGTLSFAYFVTNEVVQTTFDAGQAPSVTMNASASPTISMSATISGYMIDIP
jgi:hypothetical protein